MCQAHDGTRTFRTAVAARPQGTMTSSPLVSVVMPFLDVSPYLAEAIESVRAQTYPYWELLLCDDGSTDGSTEIAERYAARDPDRIRYLAHEHGGTLGASAARNLGLRHARGELLALLDGDDVWLPGKLTAQVGILTERPDADALYGTTENWYSWTSAGGDAIRDNRPSAGIPSNTLLAPRELLVGMLRREITVPCTCSIVVRMDAVRRSGGFVDDFRRIYTDQAFYARLSLVGSILFVDRCWDRYRRHSASAYASAQRGGEGRVARFQFLTWLDGYLAREGALGDPALRTALRAAFRRVRYPRLFSLIDRLRAAPRRP